MTDRPQGADKQGIPRIKLMAKKSRNVLPSMSMICEEEVHEHTSRHLIRRRHERHRILDCWDADRAGLMTPFSPFTRDLMRAAAAMRPNMFPLEDC